MNSSSLIRISFAVVGTLALSQPAKAATTLAQALDAESLTWTTGSSSGSSSWFPQNADSHDGVDAARSGPILNSQQSWIETTVTGPGTIHFWWKVSSEATFDFLKFFIDTNELGRISGTVNWTEKTFAVTNGTHTLRWTYIKDASFNSGLDAGWLDEVIFGVSVPTAPQITAHPTNQTVQFGQAASFVVKATGFPAPTYQWIFNDIPIPGATNASLTIPSATTDQAGRYSVTVSNRLGVALSESALLTVKAAPTLAQALDAESLTWTSSSSSGSFPWFPQSADSHDGVDAARSGAIRDSQQSWIETTVTGPGTIRFWWKVSSEQNYDFLKFLIDTNELGRISGTVNWTEKTFVVPDGTHTMRWIYSKDASLYSGLDTAWLDGVVLAVSVPTAPQITAHPTNQTVQFGQAASFVVKATGFPAPTYQWMFNDTLIPGATNALLFISSTTTDQAGRYSVTVSNRLGVALSESALLTVLVLAPSFTLQPANQSVLFGQPARFVVEATGIPGPTFQWAHDGIPIPGATNKALLIENATTDDAGIYSVTASNRLGVALSESALLTVKPAPTLAQALDAESLTWTTGSSSGSFPWFPQSADSHDGLDAARSGAIQDYQQSWIETTVTGPGTIRHWWKVSSEAGYDFLKFFIDTNELGRISGTVNWTENTFVVPDGTHTVRWVYSKDSLLNSGRDSAWLDEVVFAVSVPTAPQITAHPTNQTVQLGQSASFVVKTTGFPAPTYQWMFNDTLIPGATNALLFISSTTTDQAGRYSVTASNRLGVVLSETVLLTVLTLGQALDVESLTWTSGSSSGSFPWFPQSADSHDGVDAARSGAILGSLLGSGQSWIETRVTGPGTIRYWWKVSSEAGYDFLKFFIDTNELGRISGMLDWAEKTFTVPDGTHTLRWAYSKDIIGDSGQDAAWLDEVVFAVSVPTAPQITAHPTNQSVLFGQSARFVVEATGIPSPTFQWAHDGRPIPGATNRVLFIEEVTTDSAGIYSVTASNRIGAALSENAVLTVQFMAPLFTLQPFDQMVLFGDTARFEVAATGGPAPTLQWMHDGSVIEGAVERELIIENVTTNHAGRYSVMASNVIGIAVSENAMLSVQFQAPSFDLQPVSQTIFENESVKFTALADGRPSPTYAWLFNGAPIQGSSSTLTLTNVAPAQAGEYSAVARNIAGVTNSRSALLSVLNPAEFPRRSGGLDPSFYAGIGPAEAFRMALQLDGKILIGGNGWVRRLKPDGSTDTQFNARLSSGQITAITIQADGKVLLGSSGTLNFGLSQNRVGMARLSIDGFFDSTFSPVLQNFLNTINVSGISAIVPQRDGKVLVGGTFTRVEGRTRDGLARLNADGSIDLTFTPPTNSPIGTVKVLAMASQPDGKILVGFDQDGLGRLNENGTRDTSFATSFSVASQRINSISLQSDAKIIIAGAFSFGVSSNRLNVVRLHANGALDLSFNPPLVQSTNLGLPIVMAMLTQPNGKVLIGGAFNSINHVNRNRIARLNQDGSLDDTFSPGAGADGPVRGLLIEPDGDIVVSGDFQTIDGISRSRIARLYGDPPARSRPVITVHPVDQSLTIGSKGELSVLANGFPLPDYQWYLDGTPVQGATNAVLTLENVKPQHAGHYFVIASNELGIAASAEAEMRVILGTPGSSDPGFSAAISSGTVYAIAPQADGKIVIGGSFTRVGSVTRNRIARLHADGTLDVSFNPVSPGLPLDNGANLPVRVVAIQPDGTVVIGGEFNQINGISEPYIARLSSGGNVDTSFSASRPSGRVDKILIQSDGKLLIQGLFTSVGGVRRYGLARLNSNGSLDSGFAPTASGGSILAVGLQSDGKILIGGSFTTINSVLRRRIARLHTNGNLDTTFGGTGVSLGPNDWVTCLTPNPDGTVLIGGLFSTVDGVSRRGIARLTSLGRLDASFDPRGGITNLAVTALATDRQGNVLLGGTFTAVASVAQARIARLKPDGQFDTTFRPTVNGQGVEAIAAMPDGSILIGGAFTSVNGTPRNGIARILGSDDAAILPEVVLEPQSQTVNEGDNVRFLVEAQGAIPLGFQWSSKGIPLVGETNAVLILKSVRRDQAGGYTVTVTNRFGSITSSIAQLSVLPPMQTAWSVAPDFVPELWANGSIEAITEQSDGKLIVAGDFTHVNGVIRRRIARLNRDGTLDSSFNPGAGANRRIHSLLLQPDQKTLLVGYFDQFGEATAPQIVRLNADGTADDTFKPEPAVPLGIEGAALQPDGKILIAGFFERIGNEIRNGLARLRPDGALDTSFVPGLGQFSLIQTVIQQGDGRVLVAGEIGGTNGFIHGIARLLPDGALERVYSVPSTTFIHSLAELPEGKIWVIDERLRLLNPDGSLTLISSSSAGINCISARADGRLLVGGRFSAVDGQSRQGLAIFDARGNLDPAFAPAGAAGTAGVPSITAVSFSEDGHVLAGYSFSETEGKPHQALVRFAPDGSRDTNFSPGFRLGGTVNTATELHDGSIAVGGNFNRAGALLRNHLAGLRPDGTWLTSFNQGLGISNGTVRAILELSDGRLVVGGSFFQGLGKSLALLPTNWASFQPVFSPTVSWLGSSYPQVSSLASHVDGTIFVGGSFATFSPSRTNLLHLEMFGLSQPSGNATPNDTVNAIGRLPDGGMLIGGRFSAVNATPRNGVARLQIDGRLDSTFIPMLSAGAVVFAVTAQEDGRILLGGLFTTVGTEIRTNLARLNPDGTVDTTFYSGLGPNDAVKTLVLQRDGGILAGGDFVQFDGKPRKRLARLHRNGSLDATFNSRSGADGTVECITLATDESILVSGAFTSFDGFARNGLVRLIPVSSGMTLFEHGTLSFVILPTNADSTNALSFRLERPPSGATVNAATGEFLWTPGEAQGPSTSIIRVIVTDAGEPNVTITNQFTITVLETNAPPVIVAVEPKTVFVHERLAFRIVASDPDLPTNSLSYRLIRMPSGATIGNKTGDFLWTPDANQSPSTNLIDVVVTDNGTPNLSATNQFIVTVHRLPVIAGWRLSDDRFEVEMSAPAGIRYSLQTSIDLRQWEEVSTSIPDRTPFTMVHPFQDEGPVRFYRVSVRR